MTKHADFLGVDRSGRAPEALPLACDVAAIPASEREAHFSGIEQLFAAATSRTERGDGYAFRFSADRFADVAAFIGRERLCCSFLAFRIDVLPAGGDIVLVVTGPEGTAAFLEAEVRSGGERGTGVARR